MNEAITAEEAVDKVAYTAEKEAALQKLQGAKGHAMHIADEANDAARDLGDAARIGASALRDAASSKASSTKKRARGQFESSKQDFESRVREEPLKYIAISFGVGYFFGWFFRD